MWDYQNTPFCGPQGVTEIAEHSALDDRISVEFHLGCAGLSSPFNWVFTSTTTLASILGLFIVEKRRWLLHVRLGRKRFAQAAASCLSRVGINALSRLTFNHDGPFDSRFCPPLLKPLFPASSSRLRMVRPACSF